MKRQILEQLKTWKNSKQRLPLILKGARQVGKTHALKTFGAQSFARVHYFNFEETPSLKTIFESDLVPSKILNSLKLNSDEVIKQNELVIFDEIQQCPKALTSLKYFAENAKEVFVAAAGSLLGVSLLPESFPVGQVEYRYLTPMKFSEFLMAYNDKLAEVLFEGSEDRKLEDYHHQLLLESFLLFSACGGLPRAVEAACQHRESTSQRNEELGRVHDDLIRTYQSDFAKHAGNVNAMHINSVFQNIPSQLSSTVDGSTKRFKFKDVVPGKRGWAELSGPIDWLKNAGLVYKSKLVNHSAFPLEGFSNENLFKLYLFDSGLLGRMLRIPYQVLAGNDYGFGKGFFMESVVLSQLIRDDLSTPYFWQENKAEIEFLDTIEDRIVPIEVKSGSKLASKSLSAYIKRYNPSLSFRLSPSNFHWDSTRRVLDIPVYMAEFLTKLARGL